MSVADRPKAWTSEFRQPRNSAAEAKGSIHDDATAAKLGFKGGTVAGSIHMDQFVPGLLAFMGERWFEIGAMSLYFAQATVDAEAVQAQVEAGEDRCRLTMRNEAGAQICEGTASFGRDPESELARRLAAQTPADPEALRILKAMRVGEEHHGMPVRVEADYLAKSLERLTEPLPAYRDELVLPPSHVVHLAHQTRTRVLANSARPSVGLFGALEVEQFHGPLRAGVDYRARSKVLKLTESPKTENVWYEVVFTHPTDGPDLGRVLYLLRFMKASSPLWAS
ncbi:hypothetical protein [Phenylobacterium sp.]|uniref:hypothetical protein n=1 Tax=Phenylobacterium sp. TaxID=1871053 RepID=UPI00121A386F|nr:hypothetical protein [Phenylobacterium sp.]THD62925.1 MAG: hypothetical protein E8A49_06085 [Phenylobacterium sp.]